MSNESHFYRKILSLCIQIVTLVVSFVWLVEDSNQFSTHTFVNISMYGLIISIILMILNIWVTKSFFSNISFIFLSFVLFQFGIPILYATDHNYENFYISLFSSGTVIQGAIFSIFGIQFFSLGIIVYLICSRSNKSLIFAKKTWVQSSDEVEYAAILLFIVVSVVYVPTTIYGGFVLHSRYDLPALGGLAKQLFYPSVILILCYSQKKLTRIIVLVVALVVSIASMLTGGRTEGLVPLMVLLVYYTQYRERKINKKHGVFIGIITIVSLGIILILLMYIAQKRVNGSTSLASIFGSNMYESFVGELGFNFTTILFVMSGINSVGFQHGLSYFGSLVALFPKALDPTGIVNYFQQLSGSTWLANTYGTQLGFGLGFSLIGEAYYNFGNYGVIIIFVIGIIIAMLQSKNPKDCNNWEKYIQLVLLLGFITVPRRDFYQLIKQVEYSVFLVAFYLFICSKLRIFKAKGIKH